MNKDIDKSTQSQEQVGESCQEEILAQPQPVEENLYEKYNVRYYTPAEEQINVWTHVAGVLMGLGFLIYYLTYVRGGVRVLAAFLVCLPSIVVFGVSAIYHGMKNLKLKGEWRKIDHADISFLVLACGVPLCISLRTTVFGYIALAASFALAIFNAYLSVTNLKKYKNISFVLYFVIGALLTVVFFVNREFLPTVVKYWYAAGALTCGIGAALYQIKIKYIHGVFHIFVVLGTAFFYIGVIDII